MGRSESPRELSGELSEKFVGYFISFVQGVVNVAVVDSSGIPTRLPIDFFGVVVERVEADEITANAVTVKVVVVAETYAKARSSLCPNVVDGLGKVSVGVGPVAQKLMEVVHLCDVCK